MTDSNAEFSEQTKEAIDAKIKKDMDKYSDEGLAEHIQRDEERHKSFKLDEQIYKNKEHMRELDAADNAALEKAREALKADKPKQ